MGKYVMVDLLPTQPKLVMMSYRYVVINKCIVSLPPYMENGSLERVCPSVNSQGNHFPYMEAKKQCIC